jgi:glycolate oxidase iron-sulfur subunit
MKPDHAGASAHIGPSPALIDACVHCGFCLPACPTYALWGQEMDSPRGRIYLMKAAVEGRVPVDDGLVEHFDRCLGCLACVTACPSGVKYDRLIESMRARIETAHKRSPADRLFRTIAYHTFPYRARMRLLLLPAALLRPVIERLGPVAGKLLPRRLAAMLATAPPVTVASLFSRTPAMTRTSAPARERVGLLTGCVQQLIYPETNAASVRVLAAEGCDVVAPRRQGCCGALALHGGRLDEARRFARRTIEVFERAGAAHIVTNAAGCGSAMKEYGQLLADDPAWCDRARAFSDRVRDITELIDELGPPRVARQPLEARVVYQDACHLAHAQRVRTQPRRLLATIPGAVVADCASDMCCGSAGIYNLLEPEPARQLGDRKLEELLAARPDIIATANPGCRLQLQAAARRAGRSIRFAHPVELVDQAMHGARDNG